MQAIAAALTNVVTQDTVQKIANAAKDVGFSGDQLVDLDISYKVDIVTAIDATKNMTDVSGPGESPHEGRLCRARHTHATVYPRKKY